MNKCKSCGKKIRVRHICNTCAKRNWRKNNPIEYAYETLRSNAKRRGKEFLLTLSQFKEFAVLTEYVTKKGIKARGYTVDRIRDHEGYHKDNIQVLTNKSNAKKMTLIRENAHSYFYKNVSTWANAPPLPDQDHDTPF